MSRRKKKNRSGLQRGFESFNEGGVSDVVARLTNQPGEEHGNDEHEGDAGGEGEHAAESHAAANGNGAPVEAAPQVSNAGVSIPAATASTASVFGGDRAELDRRLDGLTGDARHYARFLSDPSALVRAAAVRRLAALDTDGGTVEAILWVVGDSDPRVRAEAARVLAGSSDERAGAALEKLRADSVDTVRAAAQGDSAAAG